MKNTLFSFYMSIVFIFLCRYLLSNAINYNFEQNIDIHLEENVILYSIVLKCEISRCFSICVIYQCDKDKKDKILVM